MIYLDNNSTTRIDPEVLEEMMPYLTDEYGNPGTIYSLGRKAKSAVETARQKVADFINAKPEQIVFTSGGTEANNMVFASTADYLSMLGRKHIITDLTEHDSILNAVDDMRMKHGFDVTYLDIESNGCVSAAGLQNLIGAGVVGVNAGLVSVMYMNNETGAENDIFTIARLCKEGNALFHTDCVQAAGCCKIDVDEIGCDFLSLSSHKIHGAKGTGALFVKNKEIISPMIIGGAMQEFGLRGGTENVAGIVGFGKACEIMKSNLVDIDKHVSILKQLFYSEVSNRLRESEMDGILHVNGDIIKHGKTLNIRFDGIDSETLLILLDSKGVQVSSGSACRSFESEPSRTLVAMGIGAKNARNSIRISFSKMNTEEEVVRAAQITSDCVNLLLKI